MRKVLIISSVLVGFTSVYAAMPVIGPPPMTYNEVKHINDSVASYEKNKKDAQNNQENLHKLVKVQKSLFAINDFINKEYSLSNNLSKDANNRVELYSMVAPKVQLEFPNNPFMLENLGYTSSVAIQSIQYIDNDQYEAIFKQTIKENNVTKDVRERKVIFTTQETAVTEINKYGVLITKIV